MTEKILWGEVVRPYVPQWYEEEPEDEETAGSWYGFVPPMAVVIFLAVLVGSSAAYLHGIANP